MLTSGRRSRRFSVQGLTNRAAEAPAVYFSVRCLLSSALVVEAWFCALSRFLAATVARTSSNLPAKTLTFAARKWPFARSARCGTFPPAA